MLQTSPLLMKSLNKTEICGVFFVSKDNLFDVYYSIGCLRTYSEEMIFLYCELSRITYCV